MIPDHTTPPAPATHSSALQTPSPVNTTLPHAFFSPGATRRLLTLTFLTLLAASTDASVIRKWDGESGSPISYDTRDDGVQAAAVTSPAYEGSKGIKAQVNTNNNATTDRSEFRMHECNGDMFGVARYMGFAIRFDGNIDQPLSSSGNWLTLHQWRQCTSMAIPPINFELQKGVSPGSGKVAIQLSVRTDSDPVNSGPPTHQYKTTLNTNQWYEIVIGADVRPAGGGFARLWIDGTQVANYTGSIGQSELAQEMEIKCGIYRGPNVPSGNGTDTVYFDEVRYGTSFNDVDPAQAGGSGGPPQVGIWYFLENRNYSNERLKATNATGGLDLTNDFGNKVQWRLVNSGITDYYYLENRNYSNERLKATNATGGFDLTNDTGNKVRWRFTTSGITDYYYLENREYSNERLKATSSSGNYDLTNDTGNKVRWRFVRAN